MTVFLVLLILVATFVDSHLQVEHVQRQCHALLAFMQELRVLVQRQLLHLLLPRASHRVLSHNTPLHSTETLLAQQVLDLF